jgi:hypothetical protein
MSQLSHDLLMLEFLSWISSQRRTYDEAMLKWQSHCPRHMIWEDAIADGYITINRNGTDHDPEIALTENGRTLLNGNENHE